MRHAAAVLALGLSIAGGVSGGCASLLRSHDIAPNGLPRNEARLRDWIAEGRADAAFARLASGDAGPSDDVLRALFLGATAYYAKNDEASSAWLELASALSEQRATKSIARSALSLIANDRVLPYEPSRTERLFVPCLAALGRLRRGDAEGAAVEARRLSALLERYDEDRWSAPAGLRATHRYLAAVVFDATGEKNDAAVAYRNAARLSEDLVASSDTIWATESMDDAPQQIAPADSGDVVLFVEHGYVANRAGESLVVFLAEDEFHLFESSGDSARTDLATLVAHRTLHNESSWIPHDKDREPVLLKIAWPVMRSSVHPTAPAHVMIGDVAHPMHDLGDVSAAVIADFEAERPRILARTIARAAIRLALSRAAEKKKKEQEAKEAQEELEKRKTEQNQDQNQDKDAAEKDNDKKGSGLANALIALGALASASSVLLEQADTRSWHLLPARISVGRIRLPAGPQRIAVEVAGERVDLGPVDVPAQGIAIASTRVW